MKIKMYDIIFAVAAIGGLYAVGLTKETGEMLISGILIGSYTTWRIMRK